jgi:hypothetical protein
MHNSLGFGYMVTMHECFNLSVGGLTLVFVEQSLDSANPCNAAAIGAY